MATNLETWENFENPEMDIRSELSNLDEEIRENDVDQGDNKEVKEKSFTFKPISVGV